MKRATHYGVAADKQEVEHLRSEVTRLRSHIEEMGDKIGQLTSLVESLAVEGAPPSSTGGMSDGAGIGALATAVSGVRESSELSADHVHGFDGLGGVCRKGGQGLKGEDSDGLCGVGAGLGRLSFACGSSGGIIAAAKDEERSAFFPNVASHAAGGREGDDATSAFLPLHVLSRKRKLMGFDSNCGVDVGGVGEDSDDDVGAIPWPSGAAATGIVKQEIDVDVVDQDMIIVKPEVMESSTTATRTHHSVAAANPAPDQSSPWPLHVDFPAAALPVAVAANAVETSVAAALTVTTAAVAAVAAGSGKSAEGLTVALPVGTIDASTTCHAGSSVEAMAEIANPSVNSIVGGGVTAGSSSSSSGTNSSEFLQGFTEQFLSFESPTASYIFADRHAGAIPPTSGKIGVESTASPSGVVHGSSSSSSSSRNCEIMGDITEVKHAGDSMVVGDVDSTGKAPEGCKQRVTEHDQGANRTARMEDNDDDDDDDEGSIDICGDNTLDLSGARDGQESAPPGLTAASAAATAAALVSAAATGGGGANHLSPIAHGVSEAGRESVGQAGILSVVSEQVHEPRQALMEGAGREGAISPLMAELQENLESLPLHSKSKVPEQIFCYLF